MTRYAAFLRAINVGGHTVKMADLKLAFEALGHAHVETFIASGNVIFDLRLPKKSVKKLEAEIEAHLHQTLGYAVATFLRTLPELAQVAAYRPFGAAQLGEKETLYVSFVKREPSAEAQRKTMAFKNAIDDFHIHGREVYWLRRAQFGESKSTGALLERALGAQATARNMTTVTKMAAKYPPTDA